MRREILVSLLLAVNTWAAPFGEAKVTKAEGYVAGTRETSLDGGTLLLSSPKDAGGITVRAGGTVTTAVGAVDFEAVNFGGNVKVISLNGKPTVSLAINPESKKGLKPGQILEVPKGVMKLPK